MERRQAGALSLASVGIALGLSSAAAGQAAGGRWHGAFGALPPEPSEDVSATTQSGNGAEDALAALGEISSFPIKVHALDTPDTFWTDATIATFVPEPAVRRLQFGDCQVEISTGTLSARLYGSDKPGVFAVKQDAIAPQTTLTTTPDESAYVSVTSELYVAVIGDRHGACKSALKGKRRSLGRVDLAETSVRLAGKAGRDFPATQVRGATGPTVFVVWNDRTQSLKLEDPAGLAPALESPLFELQAGDGGDLYLDVTAKLTVRRITAAANKLKASSAVVGH